MCTHIVWRVGPKHEVVSGEPRMGVWAPRAHGARFRKGAHDSETASSGARSYSRGAGLSAGRGVSWIMHREAT